MTVGQCVCVCVCVGVVAVPWRWRPLSACTRTTSNVRRWRDILQGLSVTGVFTGDDDWGQPGSHRTATSTGQERNQSTPFRQSVSSL